MKKLKIYFQLLRIFSFPVSIMPILVIAAFLESKNYLSLFLCCLFALVLHAAVNVKNDYLDYLKKIDTLESLGSSGVLTNKLLSPIKVNLFSNICFCMAAFLGLMIIIVTRKYLIIPFGLIGFLGAYFYTHKLWGYKYQGLGEFFVFFLFGPILTIGTNLAISENFLFLESTYIGVFFGFLSTAILLGNNIRDIETDSLADIKTLPMMIGLLSARNLYIFMILVSYILVVVGIFLFEILPIFSLITFLSLFWAIRLTKFISIAENLKSIDTQTAQLHFIFSVLIFVSFFM